MKTLEMMNKAQDTNKVFRKDQLHYSEEIGFVDIHNLEWDAKAFSTLNDFMLISGWEEVKQPYTFLEALEMWKNGKGMESEETHYTYYLKDSTFKIRDGFCSDGCYRCPDYYEIEGNWFKEN